MSTLDIITAIENKDNVAAGNILEKELSERLANAIDAKREFMTQNLFRGIMEGGVFKTKEGNSAEIKGPNGISDAEKKANGAKTGVYKEVEDAHELDGIENMKNDTKPMAQPKGKA